MNRKDYSGQITLALLKENMFHVIQKKTSRNFQKIDHKENDDFL